MLENMLLGVLLWVLGIWAGWKMRERVAVMRMDAMAAEESEEDATLLAVVEENNTLIAYNHKTNEFLAQGQTIQEIRHRLKVRFPNTRFVMLQENLHKLGLTPEDLK